MTMEKINPAIRQHSIIHSLLLHLVPGLFILAGIFIFSQPFFTRTFGLDTRLGPLFGYLAALLFGLIPVQIGILLFAGKKLHGRLSLKGIIGYLDKSPFKQYLFVIPALLVLNILLFVVIAPLIQPFIVRTFFAWYPAEYNFQLFMQSVIADPSAIAGLRGIKALLVLYIALSCVVGPFVEELYFRGYLLPRMQSYAKNWAPLINAVLFSVYHFFSPWENLIRIIGVFSIVYIVQRKRNIRFGIFVHIILNTVGGIVMFFTLFL
jgi:uncharacterized protein